jgi:hypothetical protein
MKKEQENFYDGHTEFERLSNEQRLQWLSGCARFWFAVHAKKQSNDKTCLRRYPNAR